MFSACYMSRRYVQSHEALAGTTRHGAKLVTMLGSRYLKLIVTTEHPP